MENKEKVLEFILNANYIACRGEIDRALDIIYDMMEHLISYNKHEKIDYILRNVLIEKLMLDIILGLLVTTLPLRDDKQLRSSRDLFLKKAENITKQRGEMERGLFDGL